MGKKLFNFVIGNPPYQDMTDSDSTRMPPIYDKFMDAADEVVLLDGTDVESACSKIADIMEEKKK